MEGLSAAGGRLGVPRMGVCEIRLEPARVVRRGDVDIVGLRRLCALVHREDW